jgi:hypothetical protein
VGSNPTSRISLFAFADLEYTLFHAFSENGNRIKEKRRGKILFGCYCPPPNNRPICSPMPPSGFPPPVWLPPCCAAACAGEAAEVVCII